jgi:hypothetical protein
VTVNLPVVVDIQFIDPATSVLHWRVDARVDLIDDLPTLMEVRIQGPSGLSAPALQQSFRWATPLDIVTQTVPDLLRMGIDPYRYDYPTAGYPDAARVRRAPHAHLTDEFLEEIAVQYALLGRGYAKAIAHQRHVSPRTVVSWVEKARSRGILGPTRPGVAGGGVNIRHHRPSGES